MEKTKLPIADLVDIEFVSWWKKLGDNQSDNIEKFFYYYVLFNYFYELHHSANRNREDDDVPERRKIDFYIWKNYNVLCSYGFAPSSLTNIPDEFFNKPPEDSNAVETGTIRKLNNDVSIYLNVYKIRCNLFHGNKKMKINRDNLLIEAGYILLKHIVECSMKACGII